MCKKKNFANGLFKECGKTASTENPSTKPLWKGENSCPHLHLLQPWRDFHDQFCHQTHWSNRLQRGQQDCEEAYNEMHLKVQRLSERLKSSDPGTELLNSWTYEEQKPIGLMPEARQKRAARLNSNYTKAILMGIFYSVSPLMWCISVHYHEASQKNVDLFPYAIRII